MSGRIRCALRRALLASTAGICTLLGPAIAVAQLSVYNLLVAQSGNEPFAVPADRLSLYHRLHADLDLSNLRAGLRWETNRNSLELDPYAAVTFRYAEFTDTRGTLRLGNFYTILGRGIVHRSFDLPAVVLDQPGTQARYSPSRDVDGALGESRVGPLGACAFVGRPSSGDVSPASGDARYGSLEAGSELAADLGRGARLGATYLRTSGPAGSRTERSSGFAQADLLQLAGTSVVSLPLYFEYAQVAGSLRDWFRFDTSDDVPHALYASSSLLVDPVSIALEWKDYRGYRFGTNDPPSLVREHSEPLLNRNTHVLNAESETGYQLELAVNATRQLSFTGNLSRADGVFAQRSSRFQERYLEAHWAASESGGLEAGAFYSSGKDQFVFIRQRRIAGASVVVPLPARVQLTAELQRQAATRTPDVSFVDHYSSLQVTRGGGSLALVYERSTDPEQEAPDDAASEEVNARHFVSVVGAARLSDHHNLTLFLGERRGGRACTAGTCYEVRSFRGAEFRLVSRF